MKKISKYLIILGICVFVVCMLVWVLCRPKSVVNKDTVKELMQTTTVSVSKQPTSYSLKSTAVQESTSLETVASADEYISSQELDQQISKLLCVVDESSYNAVMDIPHTDSFKAKFYDYTTMMLLSSSVVTYTTIPYKGIEYRGTDSYSYIAVAKVVGGSVSKKVVVEVDVVNGKLNDLVFTSVS